NASPPPRPPVAAGPDLQPRPDSLRRRRQHAQSGFRAAAQSYGQPRLYHVATHGGGSRGMGRCPLHFGGRPIRETVFFALYRSIASLAPRRRRPHRLVTRRRAANDSADVRTVPRVARELTTVAYSTLPTRTEIGIGKGLASHCAPGGVQCDQWGPSIPK